MLVILFTLVKCREKFQVPFESPRIIKVTKEGTNAMVEWYNKNSNIKEFVLLYVDIDKLASGVWVESAIKCDKKRCRVIIKNLSGNKYKLAILSKLDGKLSNITPDKIITFSEDNMFDGLVTEKGPSISADGDNETIVFPDNKKTTEPESMSPIQSLNNEKKNSSVPVSAPGPAPIPTLDCSSGYVKLENIKNKEELETAVIKTECGELENLSSYMKTPFYHYYWDKIF